MFSDTARAAGLAFFIVASPATAQDFPPEPWEFEAAIYLWGASIGGKTTSGEDIDIGFDDLIENLNFGAMGALAARRGPWTVFGDFIYLDVESNQTSLLPVDGGITPSSTGVSLKGFISTIGPAYRVYQDSRTRLSALAGARYLWIDSSLNLSRGLGGLTFSGAESAWDGVVGLRGETSLNEDWSISYYGDVGAGNSDFTGQVLLAANYRFRAVDLTFGYRYAYWDLRNFGPFDTLDLQGPFAGVKFTF